MNTAPSPSLATLAVPIGFSAAFVESSHALGLLRSSRSHLAVLSDRAICEQAQSILWLHAAGMITTAQINEAWRSSSVVSGLAHVAERGALALRKALGSVEKPRFSLCFDESDQLRLYQHYDAYAAVLPVFSAAFPDDDHFRRLAFDVAREVGGRCFTPTMESFIEGSYYIGAMRDWLAEHGNDLDRLKQWLATEDESDEDMDFESAPFGLIERPIETAQALLTQHEHMALLQAVKVDRRASLPKRFSVCSTRVKRSPFGRWVSKAIDVLAAYPQGSGKFLDLCEAADGPGLDAGAVLTTHPDIDEACSIEWSAASEAGETPSVLVSGALSNAATVVEGLKVVSTFAELIGEIPEG